MDKDDMALVGFVLSTVLFCFKVYEMWRARYQIEADFSSSSDFSTGNLLHIHNLTGRQIVIRHWQIFVARDAWLQRDRALRAEAEWDAPPIAIPAYSTETLQFVDEDYFSVSPKAMAGRKLYVSVRAAGKGRRTIRLRPYRHPIIEAIGDRWRRFLDRIRGSATPW